MTILRRAVLLGRRKAKHHNAVHIVIPARSCPACRRKAPTPETGAGQ